MWNWCAVCWRKALRTARSRGDQVCLGWGLVLQWVEGSRCLRKMVAEVKVMAETGCLWMFCMMA